MRRVTALVADDELIAREGLRALLAGVDWIDIVGEASNGLEAVSMVDELRPDLIFLDIEMPGLGGLEVLGRVTHQPLVVFTTAYAEHAVTGFELGAVDYLLKPFGAERLGKALDRVQASIGEPVGITAASRLGESMREGPLRRLFARVGGRIVPVAVEDVQWFEASGDYVAAHARGARYLLHLPLARLEARLSTGQFVRIHRGTIVNLAHVAAFRRREGRLVAQVRDGPELPVSRERAREIRELGV